MAHPASLIAYVFVKRGIEEDCPITQMKVQKMVFLAHGYHIAKFGTPLVEDIFQAWQFGPVIPSIYRTYRAYGSKPISDLSKIINKPTDFELICLDENAKESIEFTWLIGKRLSAEVLSTWTHTEGSPWSQVYNAKQLSIPIPNDSIKAYFDKIIAVL